MRRNSSLSSTPKTWDYQRKAFFFCFQLVHINFPIYSHHVPNLSQCVFQHVPQYCHILSHSPNLNSTHKLIYVIQREALLEFKFERTNFCLGECSKFSISFKERPIKVSHLIICQLCAKSTILFDLHENQTKQIVSITILHSISPMNQIYRVMYMEGD